MHLVKAPNIHDLGYGFKGVRYNYHAAFFGLINRFNLENIFEEIWELCERSTTKSDLEDHFPEMLGLEPEDLLRIWNQWETSDRWLFLGSLEMALRQEMQGDLQRGREKLAAKLQQALEELDEIRQELLKQIKLT